MFWGIGWLALTSSYYWEQMKQLLRGFSFGEHCLKFYPNDRCLPDESLRSSLAYSDIPFPIASYWLMADAISFLQRLQRPHPKGGDQYPNRGLRHGCCVCHACEDPSDPCHSGNSCTSREIDTAISRHYDMRSWFRAAGSISMFWEYAV